MGVLISRFRRKQSTIEQLELLEAKIQAIERRGQQADQSYKHVRSRLLAVFVGLYLICIVVVYLSIGKNSAWPELFLYGVAVLILPIILMLIGRVVSWYYLRNIRLNMIKLNEMRSQKKKIIEEVMDKETYKVAKQILDKFGCLETLSKPQMAIKPYVPSLNVPGNPPSIVAQRTPRLEATPGQLRQRQIAAVSATASTVTNLPTSLQLANLPVTPRLSMSIRKTELPRPLIPLNRSAMDKIVDYLMLDGPTNRYALICRDCHHHNGMALAEEFEYLSYHCAYCNKFNPSMKQRPLVPIGISPRAILARSRSDMSNCPDKKDMEKYSDSDSESSSDTAAELPPRCETPEKLPPSDDSVPIAALPSDSVSKKQD